ncbi:EAL domain-containing protein [Alteromonas pelagimontana]
MIETKAPILSCEGCRNGKALDFNFSMAFQPLVDLENKCVFGYEALVRGLANEPAFSVIEKVTAENIYRFDQACRVKAIALAAKSGLTKRLNINFLPGAIYRPELCIRTTLAAAEKYGFPLQNITFEIVETEQVTDTVRLKEIIDYYKKIGFSTAFDDFGSGYANLDWLAELEPNSIKLDMKLIRNIHQKAKKKTIVAAIANLAKALEVDILAEGVESKGERDCLAEMGITKQQGYFFAKPQFEAFIEVDGNRFT